MPAERLIPEPYGLTAATSRTLGGDVFLHVQNIFGGKDISPQSLEVPGAGLRSVWSGSV